MERGPLALFGALVAVGLGPALWLGAQFGAVQIEPHRPPVVSEQRPASEQLGGSGAGDDSTGTDDAIIRTTPRAEVLPLTSSPSAAPSTSAPTPSASASSEPTPSESAEPSPSATSDDPGLPPGDDESDDPTLPPAPPPVDEEPTEPTSPPQPTDEAVDY